MLKGLIKKIVGDANAREIASFDSLIEDTNALEQEMQSMSDAAFPELTDHLVRRLEDETATLRDAVADLADQRAQAEDSQEQDALTEEIKRQDAELWKEESRLLDEFLPRAFAAVREASRRTTGLRHFDVQLKGGIVLHHGKVAEMKTGEGKTLVATLPIYLNALVGRGSHVVTVNDYLAKRDTQWMGPIYHLLGMSVGVIQHDAAFLFDPDYPSSDERYQFLRPISRREAYAADITYGTNNEFGFDYLRDNMVWDLQQCVQRESHYAIVDEVDNILIDEARTPLIISGTAEESSENYKRLAALVPRLRREEDYTVEEKSRSAMLTESGIQKIEGWLGVENIYAAENYSLTPYLDNALRAHVSYQRDRDYIVKDGQVIIVDEFTGRLMHGRRYSEGLHQAIEAKENVEVQRESLTLATITFQNYFRMYRKLGGMTGTAMTEAEEFHKIYKLDVTSVPTHRTMVRKDLPDSVYKSEEAKYRAVVKEIKELYEQQRPVLVGTTSVEKSEYLGELLRRQGVTHQVLNAKLHEKEAQVIAQAGRPGAVTIATNMAGRGVDILLGGNPEGLARDELRRTGVDLASISKEEWDRTLATCQAQCSRDREQIIGLGGLHVLGTERHEARRIDNQLRGRSGRQGDPGSSRFFLSLEDDLMRRFGGGNIASLMDRLGVEEDLPIEHGLISKAIENAQIKVEGYNFDIRKHVLEYDDVVNKQREVIYAQRRRILQETSLRGVVLGMVAEEIDETVNRHTSGPHREEWDMDALANDVRRFLPLTVDDKIAEAWRALGPEELIEQLNSAAGSIYDDMQAAFGRDMWREMHRTGLTLTELAQSQGGLYAIMLDLTENYLDDRAFTELRDRPLTVVGPALEEPIRDALGRAMSLYRDRQVALRAVDNLWVRHLTDLDGLREGIGLRAYGQQDPLVSYKREAHEMYTDLLDSIRREIVSSVLRVGIRVQQQPPRPIREMQINRAEAQPAKTAARAKQSQMGKVGRNDPCPCGSGKKYKHCHGVLHGAPDGGAVPAQAGRGASTKKNR